MCSFIKSAKHVFDVESDLSYVEIIYERYTKKYGYSTFTDYINTEPVGNWVNIQSTKQSIAYEKFLDTMVKQTLEVKQRMAELMIENILVYKQNNKTYVRLLNAVKILDSTIQPPRVNMKSAWQMEFIKKFCEKYIQNVIQMCTNMSRLSYFFNVARIIELNTLQ